MRLETSLLSIVLFSNGLLAQGNYLPIAPSGGQCGANIARCPGTECCSVYNYCGLTADHCGTGCQSAFGRCGNPTATTSRPAPLPTSLPIAPSGGQCGANIARCPNSECCSQYGYCGLTSEHCSTGCQSAFGTCGVDPSKPRVIRNCVDKKMAALTFDDGPSEFTNQFLNILKRAGAKATFFVQGVQIRNRGGASLLRAFNEGHQIASHSDTHPSFIGLNARQIRSQLSKADTEISRVIKRRPRYFRFPYGEHNTATDTVVLGQGYTIVDWNLDTEDWKVRNTAKILQNLRSGMNSLKEDSIIALAHDTYSETANAVARMVTELRAKGYRLVTVAECNGDPNGAYR